MSVMRLREQTIKENKEVKRSNKIVLEQRKLKKNQFSKK